MDKIKEQKIIPGLYLVSTPIGNIEDITYRAINILKKSDIVLCEDTRRSKKLLSFYKIKNKLLPYHKFNEKKVSSKISETIKNGKIVSLISDAGTPTVSDPGIILINKCLEKNIKIFPIPGPSAVNSAMSASGFNDRYLFYGFLPKKENEIENIFKKLCNINYAIVFFVPAIRINLFILLLKKYFLDRKMVIAKEMTKIHEEFIRYNIDNIKNIPENIKGELTVVLSSKIEEKKNKTVINESVKVEIKKMLMKYSHKDVVEFISKKENLSKKTIYEYCLKFKK